MTANPQLEDGYTRISNELLEAILQYSCSGLQKDIILTIIRFTYGFQRKTVGMSINQISDYVGRKNKKVGPAIQQLIRNKVIAVVEECKGSKKARILSINKNYFQWIYQKKNQPLQQPNRESQILQIENSSIPQEEENIAPQIGERGTTKYGDNDIPQRAEKTTTCGSIKKERKKGKEKYSQESHEFTLSTLLLTLIKERRPNLREPNLQQWCEHVALLLNKDKQEYAEIEKIIRWAQSNEFWRNNILSTEKLRKQYDQLALQMYDEIGRNIQRNTLSPIYQKSAESDRILL